jgi:hypothetical protein
MLRLHPLSRSPSWRLGRPLLCKYAICGLWALNANLHENACVKFCVRCGLIAPPRIYPSRQHGARRTNYTGSAVRWYEPGQIGSHSLTMLDARCLPDGVYTHAPRRVSKSMGRSLQLLLHPVASLPPLIQQSDGSSEIR